MRGATKASFIGWPKSSVGVTGLVAVTVLVFGSIIGATLLSPPMMALRMPRFGSWTAAFALLMAVAAAAIVSRYLVFSNREQRWLDSPAPFDLFLFVLAAGICASAMLNRPPDTSWRVVWTAVLPYAQMLLVVLVIRIAAVDREQVLALCTVAALFIAATVLLDAEGVRFATGSRRPGGILGNRNFAAEYLALALPLCVLTLEAGRRKWLLPLIGLALVIGRCRTAWIAGAISGLTLWLGTPAPSRNIRLRALGLIAAGAIVATILPTRLGWRDEHPYSNTIAHLVDVQSGSGALRLSQYRQTAEAIGSNWLHGLGPGRWRSALRSKDAQLSINTVPHSDYLRVVADGGVLSLLGLLGALGFAAWRSWRRRIAAPEAMPFMITLLMIAAADVPLYRTESMVLAVLVLGTMMPRSVGTSSP
jgi:O-antigen ligase